MSSQLVDINDDGFNDILAGSFSGSPYIIWGAEDGFAKPEPMTDRSGETVLIADFWNKEESKWDETDRAGTEGHCTSVAAVDWDDDGDLDLILGDYYGGRLYLRMNEGSADDPQFATTNEKIMAGGEHLVIEKGLAAPHVVDWNDDGKFDLLCGGSKGGVYYYENVGDIGKPEFAAAKILIEPLADGSFIKKVPAYNGQPTQPGSSFHLETTDYDNDGDLDLLVGARCSWEKDKLPELTEEQQARLKEIEAEIKKIQLELSEISKEAKTDEDRKALSENEDYMNKVKAYSALYQEKAGFNTEPTESGDFVWLFRRK